MRLIAAERCNAAHNRSMFTMSIEMLGSIVLRLLVALAFGAGIGLERSYHGRPAGFRTHALVCVASTALMLVTVYGNSAKPGSQRDPGVASTRGARWSATRASIYMRPCKERPAPSGKAQTVS